MGPLKASTREETYGGRFRFLFNDWPEEQEPPHNRGLHFTTIVRER